VIHHVLATARAIRAIPVAMIEPPLLALLVAASRVTDALTSSIGAALDRAIPTTSVASATDEEDLATSADDPSKGVHVPTSGTAENLDRGVSS
jgi:hypothetical protein